MYCTNCGNILTEEASNFCPHCGVDRHASPVVMKHKISSLPKKMWGILLLAVLLTAVAVIVIIMVRNDPLVGTWEISSPHTWRTRIEFDRNGTGRGVEYNIHSSERESEYFFYWTTINVGSGRNRETILIINTVASNQQNDNFIQALSFDLDENTFGERILTLTSNWDTQVFRRVP